jgi:hypothetical protein
VCESSYVCGERRARREGTAKPRAAAAGGVRHVRSADPIAVLVKEVPLKHKKKGPTVLRYGAL